MIKAGLTGGIGTGKTIVARIFSGLGVPVYNADTEAKKAYSDAAILEEIKIKFGDDVFSEGKINLKNIAQLVFSDNTKLKLLNSIIHPFLWVNYEKWLKSFADSTYTIMESAILFETEYYKIFDKIITVTSPEEVCISRVMNRDHVDRGEVIMRMKNQLPNNIKSERSDFTIINDDLHLLIPQVIEIHKKMIELINTIQR